MEGEVTLSTYPLMMEIGSSNQISIAKEFFSRFEPFPIEDLSDVLYKREAVHCEEIVVIKGSLKVFP